MLNRFTLSFSCSNVAVVFIICAEQVYIIVIFMFKCCYSFHHSFLSGTVPFCLKICLVFFMGSLHHDSSAPPLTLSQECVIRVRLQNSQHPCIPHVCSDHEKFMFGCHSSVLKAQLFKTYSDSKLSPPFSSETILVDLWGVCVCVLLLGCLIVSVV